MATTEDETAPVSLPKGRTPAGSMIPSNTAVQRFSDARQLPPNAVVVTQAQMSSKVSEVLNKWQPRSEVWPYTYGTGMLGGLTAVSSLVIHTMYRQRFRLMAYSTFSSYVPMVVLPCAASMLLHHVRVTQDMLMRDVKCPMCYEVRACSLQTLTGLVMPMSLSLLGCLALARTKYTMHIPNVRDFSALTKFVAKRLKPTMPTATFLLASHLILAGYITNKELQLIPLVWTTMQGKHNISNKVFD